MGFLVDGGGHGDPLRLSFAALVERVPGVRHELRRWMEAEGLPPSVGRDVLVAGHEAVAHAVLMSHPSTVLVVEVAHTDGRVSIKLTSEAKWMPEQDGGRDGLLLVPVLVTGYEIRPHPIGTTLMMWTSSKPPPKLRLVPDLDVPIARQFARLK